MGKPICFIRPLGFKLSTKVNLLQLLVPSAQINKYNINNTNFLKTMLLQLYSYIDLRIKTNFNYELN